MCLRIYDILGAKTVFIGQVVELSRPCLMLCLKCILQKLSSRRFISAMPVRLNVYLTAFNFYFILFLKEYGLFNCCCFGTQLCEL